MELGLYFILATISGMIIIAVAILVLWRPGINLWTDFFVERLMKDPYPENIGEMYNVFSKVGVQNTFECDLRATDGEPLKRPFGTSKHFYSWDKLIFNPVYLSRKPTIESIEIDTKVVLGPIAKRPLYLDMPITIAGMAYGIGPSLNAKIALAKGADLVNTATSTGAGPFLPEERKHTKRLIMQYNRGFWAKEEEVLRQADAVEIQLGEAMLPNAKDGKELKKLVDYLRQLTNGAPIGIKFGATGVLEKELEIFTSAGIDFLSVAGGESGINYCPGILADDVGLPTLPALCRTVAFLNQKGLKNEISIIVSGGLVTPGQMLKCLALGADAVTIGTVACLAISHTQVTKATPWEPPTEIIYYAAKKANNYDPELGAKHLANYFASCLEEMKLAARSLGKTDLREINKNDLVALDPIYAEMAGVSLASNVSS
jgi:glutamate synthase domain-containing protein 2